MYKFISNVIQLPLQIEIELFLFFSLVAFHFNKIRSDFFSFLTANQRQKKIDLQIQPLVSKTVSKLNKIALAVYTVTAQLFVRAYIHRFTLF